jgi:hypothetical protein
MPHENKRERGEITRKRWELSNPSKVQNDKCNTCFIVFLILGSTW